MADDFQLWWDTSRSSYDGETTPAAPISTTLNAVVSFGWPTQNAAAAPCSVLANPNMRSDWNQALLRGEEDDFKQTNEAGFSADHEARSSTAASPNQTWGFRVVDSASALLSEFQQSQQMGYSSSSSYPLSGYELQPSTPLPFATSYSHFSAKTPLWNASPPPAAAVDDACSASLFPDEKVAQISDEKVKNTSEVRNLGAAATTTTKRNNAETTNKRARVETASPLMPAAFKVRKEKVGDRITALQQLVSPFGKTDTASVLSEAIEYIKFLHDQVGALSSPHMKNGAPAQKYDKSEVEGSEGEVLARRGLCLVSVSSTFPVTLETTVDFWTPTFGPPTFR